MSTGTSTEARRNPFPGLRPFRSDESHLFFGREDQAAALLRLLRRSRFLAVVGTSGSGKSSLVRAGLIPELYSGTMARAGSNWDVVLLRPGGRPLENLARALVDADLYDQDDPGTLPRLRATLSRSRFGIVEAVKQSGTVEPDANFLVVVDQFEELFRFRQQGTDSEEAAAAFVNLLLTASAQEERRIFVALTMRSDYLGDCSEIPGLAEAVNRGEYLIPRLMRDQKRDAIEKPIGVGRARISPLLVQRLLNDIGDDPDQLPVLQHALMRMWDVWSAAGDTGRPIDFPDFDATGGLANALSHHADEIYESLPDDGHRSTCERIFKALTEKGPDNRGIRRPTRLEKLEAIADSDRATVTRVLDAFRRPGVTFIMPSIDKELGANTVVDLSHESLMRGWKRLRVWVEDEAQSARVYHRLLDTASLWRDGKAGLFRDPDLQVGLTWREDERPNDAWAEQYGGQLDVAVAFLEKSRAEAKAEEEAREAARRRELEQARTIAEVERQRAAEQRRSARRLKWLVCCLGVVAVVAAAAFLFALAARKEAQKSEKLAIDRAAETERARSKLREQLYVADMNRVGRAFADGRNRQVVQLLNAHRPEPGERDLRGFEWYYWWRASHLDVRRYRESAAPYNAMAVSNDSSWVAATCFPRTVHVFDPASMLRTHSVSTTTEPTSTSISPDAALLAAAGWDDQIRVFRTSDWSTLRDIQLSRATNTTVAFSPAGGTLASGDKGYGEITLWDTGTWEPDTLQLQDFALGSNIAFSPDGSTLAVGSTRDGFPVVVWDVAAGKATSRLIGHEAAVSSAAWSPDGRLLASGSSDGTIRLWNAELEPAASLRTLGPVTYLSFSPDSKYLAAAISKDNSVRVWDTESRTLLCTIRGHRQPVGAMAFVGDSRTLWTVSQDGYIKTWDIHRADRTETVRLGPVAGDASPIGVTSLSEGRVFLTHRPGHELHCWGLDGPALQPPWDGDTDYAAVALSGDGRFMASCTPDGLLRVWNVQQKRTVVERRVDPPWEESPTSMAVSGDGSTVVLARESWSGGWLAAWDVASGVELRQRGEGGELLAIELSPDGEKLAIQRTFRVELWDWRREELLASFAEIGPPRSIVFSPDSTTLAVGYWDNNIYLYSVRTYARQQCLEGHAREVTALAFSRDGETLVSGSKDSTLKIWSAGTGKLLSTLTGHHGTVDWVAFAPDGYSIFSTSMEDDGIKIWRRATEAEVSRDVRDAVEIVEGHNRIHESDREWRQALAMLNDAIGVRPDEPQLLGWRGDVLTRLGQPLEALRDYRRALELGLDERYPVRRVVECLGLRPAVAGSDPQKLEWRYTLEKPADEGWKTTAFDATGWTSAAGPFGNTGEPTHWNRGDIWLRHEFELESVMSGPLVFLASVDDSADIYVNGVLASQVTSPTNFGYQRRTCREAAYRSLRRGKNVVAVYCHNAQGAGRIDVGLYTHRDDEEDATPVSVLSRLLDRKPERPAALEARSVAYARSGDWKGAARDHLALAELGPGSGEIWMRAATLFARAGEMTRYREVVRKMLARFGDTEVAANAEKVAKTILCTAPVDSELETATELAYRSHRIGTRDADQAWILPWAELAVGWAECRNGNHAEAITWCEKSLAHGRLPYRDAQARFILGMCHFHTGDLEKARQAWDDADRIFQEAGREPAWFEDETWHDWIICSFLRKEARALLQPDGRSQAVLGGPPAR